ncbi:MAG: hypothetical protein SFW62_04355 [Alphaproteobacteria bacterium]|nr:hypothetical protein [Alphaproteobacteria bacterium]
MSEPYLATHVVHVTDTTDRNAKLKVRSAYVRHLGRTGLHGATVDFAPALNTLDIGIVASELFNNTQRPDRLILAVNCAPPDKAEGTTNNARNDFFCADLGNGVSVCGTSNGYEFSYVKGEIKELYRLTNTNSLGSQFRSLEILPEHALLFANPEHRVRLVTNGILQREENVDDIVRSTPRTTHVFEVDNFRNVKLFPSTADLALLREHEGAEVYFGFGILNSVERWDQRPNHTKQLRARVAPTLFAAPLNTNIVALRSSSRHSDNVDGHIPIIATVRQKPAETDPSYPIPRVGAPVKVARAELAVA